MQAEIGHFHLGLTEPVIEIKNLQLYNTAQFGGTPFLNIPEIHVEYDRDALKRHEIHITLLRFNLGELDIVKGRDGQTNVLSLAVALPANPAKPGGAKGDPGLEELKKYDVTFKGIDCLNVSVGQFKYLDLQNQSNNMAQNLAIQNCVITNVTSSADLLGLEVLVGLRSSDFFKPLVGAGKPGDDEGAAAGLLKMLGH